MFFVMMMVMFEISVGGFSSSSPSITGFISSSCKFSSWFLISSNALFSSVSSCSLSSSNRVFVTFYYSD